MAEGVVLGHNLLRWKEETTKNVFTAVRKKNVHKIISTLKLRMER